MFLGGGMQPPEKGEEPLPAGGSNGQWLLQHDRLASQFVGPGGPLAFGRHWLDRRQGTTGWVFFLVWRWQLVLVTF